MRSLPSQIFTFISTAYNFFYWFTKKQIYKNYGKNYIFDVKIDDFDYKLTFRNQPITANIVQRIEGRRERETLAIYKSIIKPGMNVLELGACFGEFTVLLDHLVTQSGKVIAVEGTPNIFSILKKNFEINKLKNTEIHSLFISNADKDVIFDTKDNHPYNAINRLKNKELNKISINEVIQKKTKISEFLNKINFKPDVILMDIEGFEVDVIEDLFLRSDIKINPVILFEMHPQLYERHKDLSYVVDILEEKNYRCIQIDSNMLCYPS